MNEWLKGKFDDFGDEMATLTRAENGRFLAQSFWEKYPTGRKHCGSCRRWRHVVDFTVATWADAHKTIPHKLVSYCRGCVASKQRRRTGYRLRSVYDGQVGTEPWHQRRLAKKRARYHELRRDPIWVQARRDYFNRRNQLIAYAKWGYQVVVPPPDSELKRGSGSGGFSAVRFVEYLDKYLYEAAHPDNSNVTVQAINGRLLNKSELSQIRHWRRGFIKTVLLKTADEWAIKFDLPFWEIEEAAKIAA